MNDSRVEQRSLDDLVNEMSQYEMEILFFMAFITLFPLLLCFVLKKSGSQKIANLVMSGPIFLTTFPGVFFSLILGYLLFFSSKDLLDINYIYFIPPIWMVVSLFLYSKCVKFDDVPGFDKISGLIGFSSITFFAVLILFKLKIWVAVFFSPVWAIGGVILLYAMWKLALNKMSGA